MHLQNLGSNLSDVIPRLRANDYPGRPLTSSDVRDIIQRLHEVGRADVLHLGLDTLKDSEVYRSASLHGCETRVAIILNDHNASAPKDVQELNSIVEMDIPSTFDLALRLATTEDHKNTALFFNIETGRYQRSYALKICEHWHRFGATNARYPGCYSSDWNTFRLGKGWYDDYNQFVAGRLGCSCFFMFTVTVNVTFSGLVYLLPFAYLLLSCESLPSPQ